MDEASTVPWVGLPGVVGRLLRHAVVFVGVFWLAVLASRVTVDWLSMVPWLYLVGLYAVVWRRLAGVGALPAGRERFGVRAVGWLVGFPLLVLLGNVVVANLLALALSDPALHGLPVLSALPPWSRLNYLGAVSVLVVSTSLLAGLLGLGAVLVGGMMRRDRRSVD
ncbi:hypothetical protein ACKVMT_16995 [Halobacteriales archaeon Cl-PHB]